MRKKISGLLVARAITQKAQKRKGLIRSRVAACPYSIRATVSALDLNNVISAMVRRNWVGAGWHPPKD